MTIQPVLRNRLLSSAGLICLAMTLFLLPGGVRVVRADDASAGPVCEDPALSPGPSAASEKPVIALPLAKAGEAPETRQPGAAGSEGPAGVVVLNTRGFNYGPPPSDPGPAALGQEARTP